MVICGVIFVSEQVEKAVRGVYDKHNPISSHVRPHLTLLFPLETELHLVDIVAHFGGIASETNLFNVRFDGLRLRPEDLLIYLGISEGAEALRLLNRRLYSGELERFLDVDRPFYPHLTLGHFETEADMNRAYGELKHYSPNLDFVARSLSLLERKAPQQWEIVKTFDFREKEF